MEDSKVEILAELRTIRKSQVHLYDKIESLEGRIIGNGKPGIQDRVVTIETKLDAGEKSKGVFIALGTAIMSALIAMYSIIVKQ